MFAPQRTSASRRTRRTLCPNIYWCTTSRPPPLSGSIDDMIIVVDSRIFRYAMELDQRVYMQVAGGVPPLPRDKQVTQATVSIACSCMNY
jgi:hypothetical protein